MRSWISQLKSLDALKRPLALGAHVSGSLIPYGYLLCLNNANNSNSRCQAQTVALISLDGNEAAFSLAIVPFSARGGELHLVVGTAADTLVSPRSCSSGYLRTYKFTEDGAGLEFQHKVRWCFYSEMGLSPNLPLARRRQTTSH